MWNWIKENPTKLIGYLTTVIGMLGVYAEQFKDMIPPITFAGITVMLGLATVTLGFYNTYVQSRKAP